MIPIEQQKQLLVTRGAMYRSGILASTEELSSGLRAESLVRSAIKQIGLAAFTAWRGGSSMANLPTLVALLATGISSLWRQPTGRPLVRGAMIAAAAASVVAIVVKRKKNKAAAETTTL